MFAELKNDIIFLVTVTVFIAHLPSLLYIACLNIFPLLLLCAGLAHGAGFFVIVVPSLILGSDFMRGVTWH